MKSERVAPENVSSDGTPVSPTDAAPPNLIAVASISLISALGMAAMGISLPILPTHLHSDFGCSLTLVGWVIGLESIATLLSRPWAGHFTDRRGGKRATALGLAVMILCGAAYLLSDIPVPGFPQGYAYPLAVIVVGRILMGIGEGLLISGAGLWALDRAGPARVGLSVSWIGLGMFGGLAVGSAAGAWLDQGQPHGFAMASLVSVLIPSAAMLLCATIKPGPVVHLDAHSSAGDLVPIVMLPGLALLANACGFAAITSFLALDYTAQGWEHLPFGSPGMGVAGFGAGHVTARILFSGLSDRIRSRIPVIACFLLQTLGLLGLWLAPSPVQALVWAVVMGFGFSMIYPLLSVPLIANVPLERRGMAFGLFDGFFDIGAGMAALVSGTVAHYLALPQVFLVAAIVSCAGIVPVLLVPRTQWAPDADAHGPSTSP